MKNTEIEQILLDNGLYGSTYFTDVNFDSALLGYTEEGNIVYSYSKMVEWYIENECASSEEAEEWIQYNTLRTIPYMGDKRPIIVYDLVGYQYK